MQQLSAADSLFLSLERPECPMNMGLLVMIDGPQDADALERLLTALSAGVHKIEQHHNRLAPALLGLDHPYWIRDDRLKSAEHIHHHRLPAPGSAAQLHEMTESILMTPLDRRLPLMELHLISGLASGRLAVVFKLHHACADGLSALRMFADTVIDPEAGYASGNWEFHEEVSPNRAKWLTLGRYLRNPLRAASLLLAGPVLAYFLLAHSAPPGNRRVARQSRFVGPVSSRRSYATADLPLAEARRINRRYGTSENELLLTLYSGALRRYLQNRGELPERSLQAGMPYSMLHSEQYAESANQVGFARVTLGTRIEDPARRLLTMKARCARTLESGPSRTVRRLQGLMPYAPPLLVSLAARLYIRLLRLRRIHPTFSAITTYMPGPVRRITLGDYEISGIYPLGVLYHGCGLSLSAMRYGQHIQCGIAADRDMLPDPQVFAEMLKEEFELLCRKTGDRETSQPTGAR